MKTTNVFDASEIYFILDAQRYSESSEKGIWVKNLEAFVPDKNPIVERYDTLSDVEKDNFNQKVIEESGKLAPCITKLTTTDELHEIVSLFDTIYGEIGETMAEYLKEGE